MPQQIRPECSKGKATTGDDVDRAAALLREGGVVAMPTETVYGLAANAFDPLAVARIFEIKRRPAFDPLIVHLANSAAVAELAQDIPAAALDAMEAFWPGPLTLVLPKRPNVPDIVTSGLATVALRIPDHPLALALLQTVGLPLAAPSANPFGYLSPTTAAHVADQLGGAVDYILDGGSCPVGVESTILTWHSGRPVLLRAGGYPLEELERVVGRIEMRNLEKTDPQTAPQSPGRLPWHYAPRTPLRLVTPTAADDPPPTGARTGWIGLAPPSYPQCYDQIEALAPGGDLRQAAAGLFAALHRLDAAGLDLIVAQLVPENGLGLAINDRLRRAAAVKTAP